MYVHDIVHSIGVEKAKTLGYNPVPKPFVRLHIMALGDVGMTMLIGLRLLSHGAIASIGMYDINEKNTARLEMEINQIRYPFAGDGPFLPPVEVITKEELFQCDVFVFCASKGVPPVGAGGDVRLAQLEANRFLVYDVADAAKRASFAGFVCIVSDPVELLSQAFLQRSGLEPSQVQGYGLGVMHARALYYAERNRRFASYLQEGRAFGPHGADLVLANSIEHYDDVLSKELTKQVVQANMAVRDLGYKPYIAPALSSAAISILLTLQGKWHYSSIYFGDGIKGTFFGVKNKLTSQGMVYEDIEVPKALFARLAAAYQNLCTMG